MGDLTPIKHGVKFIGTISMNEQMESISPNYVLSELLYNEVV